MSRTEDAPSERDEIEMLLPWYVTGRLDPADAARVATWIARDPLLARQLRLIEEEHHHAVASAETVRMPAGMSVERTISGIPAIARSSGRLRWFADWFDSVIGNMTPARMRWAAAGALLLIALQAASIGVLLRGQEDPAGYQTASGGSTVADGTFVLARVAGTISVATLNAALKDLNATISSGPTAEGFYQIRIGHASMEEEARKASMERMKSRSEIFLMVLPVPRSAGTAPRTAP